MGRRKIEIQPITHERNRSVTFLKRKNGLFKKAYELGVLCSVDVAVIIFEERPGHDTKLHQYSSSDIRDIIQRQLRHQGERDAKGPSDFSGSGEKYDDNGDGDEDAMEEEDEPPARPVKRKATGKVGTTPSIATPTNGTYTAPSRNGRSSAQTPLSSHGVRGFEEGPSSSSVLPVSNDRVSSLRDTSTRASNKRPRSESDVDPAHSRSPSEDAQVSRSSLFLPDQRNSGRGYARQIRYPHEMGPPQESGSFNHHGSMQPSTSHSFNSSYNSMFPDTSNPTLIPFPSSRNSPPQQMQSYSREMGREEYFPPRGRFSDTEYDLNSYSNPARQSPPPPSSMHFSPWPQQQPREGRLDFSAFLEADERSRQQQSILQSRTQSSGLEWPTHETPRISRGTMGPPVSSIVSSSINPNTWFDVFSENVGDTIAPGNKDAARTQGTSWERGTAADDMTQVFESTKKQVNSRPSASNALQGIIVPDVPPQGGSMATSSARMQVPAITISTTRDSEEPPVSAGPVPMDADTPMQPPQPETGAGGKKHLSLSELEALPPTSSDDASSQPSSRTGENSDVSLDDSDKPQNTPAGDNEAIPSSTSST